MFKYNQVLKISIKNADDSKITFFKKQKNIFELKKNIELFSKGNIIELNNLILAKQDTTGTKEDILFLENNFSKNVDFLLLKNLKYFDNKDQHKNKCGIIYAINSKYDDINKKYNEYYNKYTSKEHNIKHIEEFTQDKKKFLDISSNEFSLVIMLIPVNMHILENHSYADFKYEEQKKEKLLKNNPIYLDFSNL